MDITITLTAEQESNGTVVGAGDVRGLCQRLIDGEAANWAEMASRSVDTARLAKLKAAPKALQDQVDAITIDTVVK